MFKRKPASIIQRAYRRYTCRRIYHYFKHLILLRQSSDPILLLKVKKHIYSQMCMRSFA